MIKTLLYGVVRNAKLSFNSPAELAMHLQKLDGDVEISIAKKRKKRSLNQNSYYWGVIVEILANHFYYDKEEMHTALRFKFLIKFESNKPTTAKSSTALSTSEWEEYMTKIRMWAATSEGLNIPEPNEVDCWE